MSAEAVAVREPREALLPPTGLRRDLQAIKIVWLREFILLRRSWVRLVFAFVQPFLFLFVLGTGLGPIVATPAQDVEFKTFIYPGVLMLAALWPSFLSAASIVVDREHGFLREMLVAPVRRGSIVIGKCLGGATVATIQAGVLLALAAMVDVPYNALMLLQLAGVLLLASFTLTAIGVVLAALIREFATYLAVVQLLIMPMLFLSGAMFPLGNIPGWLELLTRLDPVSYAVDPLRRIVFDVLGVSVITNELLNPGITWWGWKVPIGLEIALVAGVGFVMLGIAIRLFQRTE
jgi:ABC-2 type transport system permease protein